WMLRLLCRRGSPDDGAQGSLAQPQPQHLGCKIEASAPGAQPPRGHECQPGDAKRCRRCDESAEGEQFRGPFWHQRRTSTRPLLVFASTIAPPSPAAPTCTS